MLVLVYSERVQAKGYFGAASCIGGYEVAGMRYGTSRVCRYGDSKEDTSSKDELLSTIE